MSGFMKMGRAMEIVIELAQQNVADQLDDPTHYAEQTMAILTVEDWVVNNLEEDD